MLSASSCMFVFPITIAPAAHSRRTTGASLCGRQSPSAGVPAVHGRPAKSMLSLTATGSPASGPPVDVDLDLDLGGSR